jgi:hypothetical protein
MIIGLCSSCSTPDRLQTDLETPVSEKPFAAGGSLEMRLDAGNYVIRSAAEDRIRVSFGRNTAKAGVELTSNDSHASLAVKDTPKGNFRASIEVPRTTNLVIHLKAGNLELAGVAGNKDIDSGAGNVQIAVGDPNDYSDVDASLTAGDIDAGAFGKSGSGINPHVTWTGHGKYSLRAKLGAGNLVLKTR